MNGKLILGIVLLVILALTGVVSAATTGRADLSATVNIPQQSLTLTITGSQSTWTMDHVGSNTNPASRPQISIASTGYPNGWAVTVADKQSPPAGVASPPGDPKGYFYIYDANANVFITTHLKNSLHAVSPCGDVTLSGIDQACFNNQGNYGPVDLQFDQNVDNTDQNGNYRIFVTYTVTPN